MKFDIYLIWIIIPLFFGFLSGSIGKPDEWYEKLQKPSLNPPRIVFPIAWTILYILLGFAYYYGLYKKARPKAMSHGKHSRANFDDDIAQNPNH